MRVVGMLTAPDQLIPATQQERPHVILVEIETGGADLLGMVSRIARQHSLTRTLVYSAHARPGCVHAALTAGAVGFVAKSDPVAELIQAVREAPTTNRQLLSTSVRTALAALSGGDSDSDPTGLSQLTPREVQVLCLIGRGFTRNDIAEAIRRSPKTVDAHRASIMGKLGFKDRVQLARFAIREGIIEA